MSGAFDKLKEEFLAEAEETLSAFRQDLARFDDGIPAGSLERRHVDRAFRTAHSLKGVLGMFGLDEMARVAHALEDVLDEIRAGRLTPNRSAVEVLLEGNEALHELLAHARGAPSSMADASAVNEIVEKLAVLTRGSAPDLAPAPASDPLAQVWPRLSRVQTDAVRAGVLAGRTVAVVVSRAASAAQAAPSAMGDLEETIRAWGTIDAALDDEDGSAPGTSARRYIVDGEAGIFALAKAVGERGDVLPCDAERVVRNHTPAAEPRAAIDSDAPASGGTVRVRVERIDGLLEGLDGLLQAKMALDDAVLAAPPADRMRRTELTQILRRLDREIRSLQEDVLDVRLVGLGALVPKLERIAWSAAREAGKSVRLACSVGDVEVDKEIVDALIVPLAHLVRNAIDHGIEDEAVRRARGKNGVGTIRIEARSAGAEALVEVADDGPGIDLARVLEKARARQILPHDRDPEEAEILEALFAPGFSTRDTPTSLSGRGVGLDAARDAVGRLGGALEIETGRSGTRVRLRVPTTRAILSGLLVRARTERIVLPLAPVARVIKIHPSDVEQKDGEESLVIDGRRIPVLDLGVWLGIGPVDRRRERILGVHLTGSVRETILLVDEVGARRDVITRRLELVPQVVPGIVGTTELGDGRAVLLLDPAAIEEIRGKRCSVEESGS